jgi:hypothetical protein
LYDEDIGTSQVNQDKETSTDKLERENKRRNSEHKTKNPVVDEIFRKHPDMQSRPPIKWIPGLKWPGRGFNHPPPSSAEVKERVELYLYSSSGPS